MPDRPSWLQLERTVRAKAWRLVRHFNLNKSDLDDIQQEIWLGLLTVHHTKDQAHVSQTDSACASSRVSGLEVMVANKIASILTDREDRRVAQKRDADRHLMVHRRDPLEQRQLEIDVEQLTKSLPAELQNLCRRLRSEYPLNTVDTDRTSYRLVAAQLKRLQHIFESADLKSYLP